MIKYETIYSLSDDDRYFVCVICEQPVSRVDGGKCTECYEKEVAALASGEFETEKALVASTAHCSGQHELETLIADSLFIAESYEYGIRLWLNSEEFPTSDELSNIGYSDGLCQIIHIAKHLGCDWLRLDIDGLIYNEAPHYKW